MSIIDSDEKQPIHSKSNNVKNILVVTRMKLLMNFFIHFLTHVKFA